MAQNPAPEAVARSAADQGAREPRADGKSFAHKVVVEADGTVLVNNTPFPVPPEGHEGPFAPLGWVLDRVKMQFEAMKAQDPEVSLTLHVQDRRPRGVSRRAVVKDASWLSVEGLVGPSVYQDELARLAAAAAPAAPAAPAPDLQDQYAVAPSPDQATAPATLPSTLPSDEEFADEVFGPTATEDAPPADAPQEDDPHPARPGESFRAPAPEGAPSAQGTDAVAATPAAAPRGKKRTRAEMGGWVPLPPERSTRPEIEAAEGGGKGGLRGLLAEEKRQKVQMWAAGIIVVLAVIVGFRVFNGAQEFDAVCVDQRTMTRAATGVACEQGTDTNFRWWYTDEETLPGVGDTVDTSGVGTFKEPTGSKVTVKKHVEAE